MNKYKDEMNKVHMSDDLKQKISNLPYENSIEKKSLSLFLPKILISCSLILVLFVSFLSISILNNKEEKDSSKKEEVIVADDGKQVYTPTISGVIGGKGGSSTFTNDDKPSVKNQYIPKQLPIYQMRYESNSSVFTMNDKNKKELIAWLNEYAKKLSIDENITELYFRNQDVTLMITPDFNLEITLSNAGITPNKVSAKNLKEQIKNKVQSLIPFENSTWECNETYCDVYEKGKTKKESFINQKINRIKITPYFLPSLDSQEFNIELSISIDNKDNYQKVGEVSVIDEKCTRNLLNRGGYYYMQGLQGETLPSTIEENQILSTELMYGSPRKQDMNSPYVLPVYRYQIKLNDNDIRFFDVIAVPQKELEKYQETIWYFQP